MRRDQHQGLVTLALEVLDCAAYASSTQIVATPAVRLALRVLLPYVHDRAGLLVFWERAQSRAPHPWDTCREAYQLVARTLRDAGWHAPATPGVGR